MSKVTASHILVDKEHEALDLIQKLKEGKSFESLAKEFSKCPSGRDGGSLGNFRKRPDGGSL